MMITVSVLDHAKLSLGILANVEIRSGNSRRSLQEQTSGRVISHWLSGQEEWSVKSVVIGCHVVSVGRQSPPTRAFEIGMCV